MWSPLDDTLLSYDPILFLDLGMLNVFSHNKQKAFCTHSDLNCLSKFYNLPNAKVGTDGCSINIWLKRKIINTQAVGHAWMPQTIYIHLHIHETMYIPDIFFPLWTWSMVISRAYFSTIGFPCCGLQITVPRRWNYFLSFSCHWSISSVW